MRRLQRWIGVLTQGHCRVQLEVGNIGFRLHGEVAGCPGAAGIVDQTVEPRLTTGFCGLSGEAISMAARAAVGNWTGVACASECAFGSLLGATWFACVSLNDGVGAAPETVSSAGDGWAR